MGQKVHPYSFRLGYIKDWKSRWYAGKEKFGDLLCEDMFIRKHIRENLSYAGISVIEIERAGERIKIIIHTSRPGVVIGRRGTSIDALRDELQDKIKNQVFIDIKEVKNPAVNAKLVADNIAFQLIKRVNFRRAMKKSIQIAIENGVEGIKISCAGRLNGAEMSRKEVYKEGKIPLQTIRADIDYGFSESKTNAGTIGVKVWIYHGDVLTPHETADNINKE